MDWWHIENEINAQGFEPICGVDEAGRGPLAGPVYAAAVILPRNLEIAGLNDSKKLSEKHREEIYDIIIDKALAFGIAYATVEEIEEFNILNATFMAMNRAIKKLTIRPQLALIDGNQSAGIEISNRTIIGGDGKCASIAAASILAKVSRDRYMIEIGEKYPEYSFKKHKGYGTKAHFDCLKKYGVTDIHRKSFLSKLYGEVNGL